MKVASYHVEGMGVDLKITPGLHRKWVASRGTTFELEISFSRLVGDRGGATLATCLVPDGNYGTASSSNSARGRFRRRADEGESSREAD
jgi:hypothetical protein